MADEDWDVLKRAKWCSTLAPGPGKQVDPTFFAVEDQFYAPEEIRPREDALSVSGACPLLDGKPCGQLKEKLGWMKPPAAQFLKAQLAWLDDQVDWSILDIKRTDPVLKFNFLGTFLPSL